MDVVDELAVACHVTWLAPLSFSSSLSSEINHPTINLSSHDSSPSYAVAFPSLTVRLGAVTTVGNKKERLDVM